MKYAVENTRVGQKTNYDKLILDMAELNDITSDHVAGLVRLLSEAGTLGIKTAICAPDEHIVSKLRQIAETRDAPCAATRDAARDAELESLRWEVGRRYSPDNIIGNSPRMPKSGFHCSFT